MGPVGLVFSDPDNTAADARGARTPASIARQIPAATRRVDTTNNPVLVCILYLPLAKPSGLQIQGIPDVQSYPTNEARVVGENIGDPYTFRKERI